MSSASVRFSKWRVHTIDPLRPLGLRRHERLLCEVDPPLTSWPWTSVCWPQRTVAHCPIDNHRNRPSADEHTLSAMLSGAEPAPDRRLWPETQNEQNCPSFVSFDYVDSRRRTRRSRRVVVHRR